MLSTDRTVSTASKAATIRGGSPDEQLFRPVAFPSTRSRVQGRGDHGVDGRVAGGGGGGADLGHRDAEREGGQAGAGRGQHGVVDLVGEFDGLLLDRPVGQDDHQQASRGRARPAAASGWWPTRGTARSPSPCSR